MAEKLHIVCPDAPSPPDYGGAIDVYCKIKALAAAGVTITLHYFDYKPGRNADGLKQECANIFSYRRESFLQAPTFSKPHIVASRINQQLIERLNADDDPVLLEYIHCTGILPYIKNKSRRIVVRLHNDEAVYYNRLAYAEPNFFKKTYYRIESILLRQHQKKLPPDVRYVSVSQKDAGRFENYGLDNVIFLPVFVPWEQVSSRTGAGTYCLYHGNLSVTENEAAALWLIQNVFSKLPIPFIIAGRNSSGRLQQAVAPFQHITLVSNPSDDELDELIEQAHIHVLPDFNNTGIKLKLLHALFCGRFCITRSSEIKESSTIAFAQAPQEYMGFLKSFMNRAFTAAHITERTESLRLYNNPANAQALTALL